MALTTATASLPGSRPSWRADSLLISETTVCGPHCISTSAITVSATTRVTRPTNRLRAELAIPNGSGGGAACSRANSARTSPRMTFRPVSSCSALSAPVSTQRRTVSSLTPSRAAASLIRMVVTL